MAKEERKGKRKKKKTIEKSLYRQNNNNWYDKVISAFVRYELHTYVGPR